MGNITAILELFLYIYLILVLGENNVFLLFD